MREESKNIAAQRFYGREHPNWQVRAKRQPVLVKKLGWKFSLLLLVLCCALWAWLKVTNPVTFPIKAVRIQGNYQHVDRNALQQVIIPFLHNGFVRMDVNGLQDRLSQLPWVYLANVHRVWPATVVINLVQQQPVARYNNNTLMNAAGDLFSVDPATIPAGLPNFIGPVGQQQILMQNYQQMSAMLAPLGLKISSIGFDARRSWQVQLNNGIVVLIGKAAPLARLQRFVEVYSQVVGNKAANIASVDLRYANGIAVTFKNNGSNNTNTQD